MTGSVNGAALGIALFLSGGSFLFWGPEDNSFNGLDDKVSRAADVADSDDAENNSLWATIAVVTILLLSVLFYLKFIGVKMPKVTKGDIKVRILRGTNLKNINVGLADRLTGDKSDTYLRATGGSEEFHTPTMKNDLNPDWQTALNNAEWVFHGMDLCDKARSTVKLEVFDNHQHIFSNDVYTSIGTAELDLTIFAQSPGRWLRQEVPLRENGRRNGSKVEVEMCFVPQPRGIVRVGYIGSPIDLKNAKVKEAVTGLIKRLVQSGYEVYAGPPNMAVLQGSGASEQDMKTADPHMFSIMLVTPGGARSCSASCSEEARRHGQPDGSAKTFTFTNSADSQFGHPAWFKDLSVTATFDLQNLKIESVIDAVRKACVD